MARIGSFGGPETAFGQPLSAVHPPDNVFPTKVEVNFEDLTEQQRRDLEALLTMLNEGRAR